MIQLQGISHGLLDISFIKPTLGDDQLHTHINHAMLKLLHEKAGLTASFMTDVYESPDWTVFPTVSSTTSSRSSIGTSSLTCLFILIPR